MFSNNLKNIYKQMRKNLAGLNMVTNGQAEKIDEVMVDIRDVRPLVLGSVLPVGSLDYILISAKFSMLADHIGTGV